MNGMNPLPARWSWPSLLLVGACAMTLAGCDLFRGPDDRVARADAQIAAHDYRGAMIELKNALQDSPGHVQARARLAQVEFEVGEIAAAEKDLQRAIALGAKSPAVMELQARIDLALGRAQDLLSRIDAKQIDLEGSARPLYRGEALLVLRRFEEAGREFESISKDDPRSGVARIGAADSLAGAGNNDEALRRFDALLSDEPNLATAWLARGLLHARSGDMKSAGSDLERAYVLGRDTLDAVHKVALLAPLTELRLARGDFVGATAAQAELAHFAPDALPVRLLAARISLARGDHAAAVAQLQRVVVMYPDSAGARFLLGAALFKQGSLHQAETQLMQVLEHAPEHVEARKLLAQIHLLQNRPDAAVQVLLPAQQPDDTRLDFLLGLARLQQGKEDEGIAHLERAAAAEPGNANIRLDLAAAYLRIGRADKALALLSAMNRNSTEVRQSALLIAAQSASGNAPAARAEVERIMVARPRDPNVYNLGAAFYSGEQKFERARALAQRAMELDPGSAVPLLTRAHIELEAGAPAAARQWLEKAVALDKSGEATLALARLSVRQGDPGAATAALEKLRAQDPALIEPRLDAGIAVSQAPRLHGRQAP